MHDIITMAMIVLVAVVVATIMTAVCVISTSRGMSGMISMNVTTNAIIYAVTYVISRRVVGWIVGTDSHGFCSTKVFDKSLST